MGLFKWLLGGAAAAKVYNKLNRPIIEFPSTEYTLYALENSGMTGRKWLVRYKYKGSKYTAQIDTGTRGFSVAGGGPMAKVYFPWLNFSSIEIQLII